MKIAIFTLGTRGDVQPYLALAKGLQRAGHQVILAASYNYTDWIQSHGIQTYPLGWSIVNFLADPEVKAALQSRNIFRVFKTLNDGMEAGFIQVNDELWNLDQDIEFVVQTVPLLCGVEFVQQRALPMVTAYLAPAYTPPTRAFPWFGLPWRFSLGGSYNYLTHIVFHNIPGLLRPLNRWRTTRLGLPPLRSTGEAVNPDRNPGTPTLYCYSPALCPKPPEWGETHHVTGYWFLESAAEFQPPADLQRFLASGTPPVYIGFGSMSDRNPERLTRLVLRALELTGQRGVLDTGWGGVKQLPSSDHIFYLDGNIPHDWLFPQMAAVVHHGGAGTTAAGLRAAVPTIITPFSVDQYGWADLVAKLGVGPRVVNNVKKLTAEKLAQAINRAVNDDVMRARVAALSEKIRAEDGVARAVEVIERHAADFHRRLGRKVEMRIASATV